MRLSLIITLLLVGVSGHASEVTQPREFFYQATGHQLHAMESGSELEQPVLLIHGSPATLAQWKDFLTFPTLANFNLIAMDRPGYGKSEPGKPVVNLQTQSEEVWAARQKNRSGKKPIVVGYSFGGANAAQLIMDHSNEIGCAVLVSGTLAPHSDLEKWFYQVPLVLSSLVPPLYVSAMESRALPEDMTALIPRWTEVKIPVVIIQGLADTTVDPATADFAKEKLVNSPQVIVNKVPGLDHRVVAKRPDLVVQGIQQCSDMMNGKMLINSKNFLDIKPDDSQEPIY